MVAIITADKIRQLVTYDQLTGSFFWKHSELRTNRWNTRWAGKLAGTAHSAGYWCISIDGVKHLAHRLAWLYHYGILPGNFIDHKNLNKRDNRIENLRLASSLENCANISDRQETTSGYRGVWFRQQRGRWCAQITHNYQRKHLGTFKTKRDAHLAYAEAARELYGEFCPQHLQVSA